MFAKFKILCVRFVPQLGLLSVKGQFSRSTLIVVGLFFLFSCNSAYLVSRVNFWGRHLLWLIFSSFLFVLQLGLLGARDQFSRSAPTVVGILFLVSCNSTYLMPRSISDRHHRGWTFFSFIPQLSLLGVRGQFPKLAPAVIGLSFLLFCHSDCLVPRINF